ncbi:MAG: lysophospholipid acyltransferase family protein [Hyphomicrobiales bacterium]
MFLWVGMNVRHIERLPKHGPALIAANHNSHMDTLALLSLFPIKQLRQVRAVAAADYFLANPVMRFIALELIGILPIERTPRDRSSDPVSKVNDALDAGQILIFFPEGTRGDPEQLSRFKKGLARLAELRPEMPVFPIFLYGFGKVLPKGSFLPVPFFCDVFIGEVLPSFQTRAKTMSEFEASLEGLSSQVSAPNWQ